MTMTTEDQNHIYQHLLGSIEQLKRCPFCGGRALIEEVNIISYRVYCENCNAEMHPNPVSDANDPKMHVECINLVVSDWNQRVQL